MRRSVANEIETLESRLCLGLIDALPVADADGHHTASSPRQDVIPPAAEMHIASNLADDFSVLFGAWTNSQSPAADQHLPRSGPSSDPVPFTTRNRVADAWSFRAPPENRQEVHHSLERALDANLAEPWIEPEQVVGEREKPDFGELSDGMATPGSVSATRALNFGSATVGGLGTTDPTAKATFGGQPKNEVRTPAAARSENTWTGFVMPGETRQDNHRETVDGAGDASGSVGAGPSLYLNFDGADLTHQDLVHWSQDWSLEVENLDPEGDGIRVAPFLQGTPGWQLRETVIDRIISLVETDLSPFGIPVLRHFGKAVEGQGATTVFLGANSLSGNHNAGDIDFGNDNRTDVAFVGNEWWGNWEDTAYALADVTLHEAGHTYGLFHVDARLDGILYPDSMGLRYGGDVDQWVRDTRFVDRTFVEFGSDGGGRGFQNSYQTMLRTFVQGDSSDGVESVQFAVDERASF